MANDILVEKWKHLFQLGDMNKDKQHTIKDADMFAERFSSIHELDEDKAKQVKEKAHFFWKTFYLADSEQIDEAEFLQHMTAKFNANPGELRSELLESLEVLTDVFDVDNDGFISTEELMCAVQAWGLKSALDESFVDRFPQAKPGFIKREDYAMSWLAYYLDTDETVAKPVTEAMEDMSKAGVFN